MRRYLMRRLVLLVFVVWGVVSVTFVVTLKAGDPAAFMYHIRETKEEIEELRRRLGLDRPLHEQYFNYLVKAVQGDFGSSIRHRQPATALILDRLPYTLLLGGLALLISFFLALPIGVLAAVKRGTSLDGLTMLFALVGQAIPVFWLGILLILIFGVWLRWLPVSGAGSLKHLALPAVTLAAYPLARNARLVRSSVLEVLGREYVTTARAKGLKDWTVLIRHVLRNALMPIMTLNALDLGSLLGGAVITESVFGWPGMGRLTVLAIRDWDYPVVQAGVALIAMTYVLANLLVDLLYLALDPRIRLEGQ
ncbi:MAG: ABC transporter permease [Caldilineaceae bacterium]|uniref:ABC transporter permease n=1 Tax=Caldilineaceae bacterium SB0675_bin_29 TaxID=2605266 RepID=A0A6B1G3L8_9CHLR|nr:ABC transporter permease [Caldilineaceae bacterium]MYH60734.1 ABC transporter permease [Caldilineaceae bacterium SB0675_bin_29]